MPILASSRDAMKQVYVRVKETAAAAPDRSLVAGQQYAFHYSMPKDLVALELT